MTKIKILKLFAIIIISAIFIYLIYDLNWKERLFLVASIVAPFIIRKIIQWYKKRKLNSVESAILYIIVGVPILSNIFPIIDLIVLSATAFACVIFDYKNKNENEPNDMKA